MKLKFHDPVQQTVPDAMHTVKDAIEHFFYLIVGRDDSKKVKASEVELQRFGASSNTSTIPYVINKEQKKQANMRACSVVCPQHTDFVSHAFFGKTHFKSHDWKQVLLICIRVSLYYWLMFYIL